MQEASASAADAARPIRSGAYGRPLAATRSAAGARMGRARVRCVR